MPPAKQGVEERRFSNLELRVQRLASHRARKQLLRVPWNRFRRAYEEYPHWQGLALWSRAVIDAQGRAPSELLRAVRERCPGLFQGEALAGEPNLLAFHLLEWVHNDRFGYAKRQGWLDALTFYGVRHLHSQAAWAFWEYCENEWNKKRPRVVSTFDQWWDAALQMKICGEVSYLEATPAVEKYIDWEAMTLWLRPLFASDIKLPVHVVSELERWFPNAPRRPRSGSGQGTKAKSTNWQSLIRAGKEYCLSGARGAGWLESFVERVRVHPRHVRLMAYGKDWAIERSGNREPPYPSFRQWWLAVDRRRRQFTGGVFVPGLRGEV